MNEFSKEIDNIDSAFPQYEAECQSCDMFLPVNDLGLCEDCAGKLDLDMIRKRDWTYWRFFSEEEFALCRFRNLRQSEKNELLEQEMSLLQTIADQYPDIFIAVENAKPDLSQSPYTYGESVDALKEKVQQVNKENVRINLDFGHLHMSSKFYNFGLLDKVDSIRHLVVHTHIHDNFGGAVHYYQKQQTYQLPLGKGDNQMPLGWGQIPIKEIINILLPDYTGLFMMELRSRYFNYIEESKMNLAAIIESLKQAA